MFLKTLSMKGFKSFADSTRLDLEPGVTVVVGPNGSGKSNVVDAMAWVLGAQRPSAVRSQKMDDVIFAGTSKKKALGRAEVAITLDNSARLMPIEFEEVTITRRLFRTGDSEYEINGVPCRLMDIQDLLSDSGVGRQQHVIISQGQIDAVLNARPEDRRSIIEEAAGVLKYRRRKEKSERRLEACKQRINEPVRNETGAPVLASRIPLFLLRRLVVPLPATVRRTSSLSSTSSTTRPSAPGSITCSRFTRSSGSLCCRGSCRWTTVLEPRSLSITSCPPHRCTKPYTMLSPRPLPLPKALVV